MSISPTDSYQPKEQTHQSSDSQASPSTKAILYPNASGHPKAYESPDKSPQDDNLPMTLELQGDEPFFSEFDLSADQTMEILGIKRSRLNQIAGRNLRVARTRVDRYIRPIFRSIDVLSYRDWTRSTASHKKSQDQLEKAAKELEQHTAILAKNLSEDSGIVTTALNQHLVSLNDFMSEKLNKLQTTTKHAQFDLKESMVQQTAKISLNIAHLSNKISRVIESQTLQINDTQDLKSGLILINSNISQIKKRLETQLDMIGKTTANQKADIEAITSDIDALGKTADENFHMMVELIEKNEEATKHILEDMNGQILSLKESQNGYQCSLEKIFQKLEEQRELSQNPESTQNTFSFKPNKRRQGSRRFRQQNREK